MGRCKSHNINLILVSPLLIDVLVLFEFWSQVFHSVLRAAVCHMLLKTPAPLPAVRSGTSPLSNPLLCEQLQTCHQAEPPGLGEPGKKVHVTELLLLVPVTTTVLLRDFSISPRRWSLRRGYSQLNTADGFVAHVEEGRIIGWTRNQFSGDYKTKLSSLLEPVAIHFPETCPGWTLLMLSSPPTCIYTGTNPELLKRALCFYFCCPPPCLPESHHLSNKNSF